MRPIEETSLWFFPTRQREQQPLTISRATAKDFNMFRVWGRSNSFPQGRPAEIPVKETKPVVPDIKPEDAVIAVMGVTGVGKSTFISHFSKTAVVGNDLSSCTTTISIHTACIEGQNVYLIDTPGFDDTTRTDTDILKEIATWLKKSYDSKIQLTGIVYLHRILDNRVGGSGTSTIEMFKELCGESGLSSVVLATTMWDTVPLDKAEEREEELKTTPEFWGGLIEHGCRVFRQNDGSVSAARIIRHIVSRGKPTTLQIQEEIASGLALNETKAGKVLEAKLEEQSRVLDETRQALEEQKRATEEQRQAMEEQRRLQEEQSKTLASLQASLAALQIAQVANEEKAERERAAAAELEAKEKARAAELEAKIRSLEEELESNKQKQEKNNAEREDLRNSKSWFLDWCVVM
ncbi:P-loop containing nucleoside triphosphate hydrolase protein [Echria macrotheca]|uniref:P-loop containing nucleoside triphosphate hydrolase protein n=1 Tax=Echria macrotheca TaxID=438768 RepID=A0AAJ0BF93_9PEZI|nr:P-loop containing nucleoside triphosphate hydrolase protein [Echria macrotheca]